MEKNSKKKNVCIYKYINACTGLPRWLSGQESAHHAGDPGSILGLGISPGGGHGTPLQYSCLENPMDGGAWWDTVHGVAKSWTRLSNFTFTNKIDFMLLRQKAHQKGLPSDSAAPK